MRVTSIVGVTRGTGQVPPRGRFVDWSRGAAAAFRPAVGWQNLPGSREHRDQSYPLAQKIGYPPIRASRFARIVPCTINSGGCPIRDRLGGSQLGSSGLGRPGDWLQDLSSIFCAARNGDGSDELVHWMKPGVIERGVRTAFVTMLHRMRSPVEVLMDVADMMSMMTRPQKSFVAMRIARPQHRVRASGFVERHITEK